jgi:hypothetical protein
MENKTTHEMVNIIRILDSIIKTVMMHVDLYGSLILLLLLLCVQTFSAGNE